jgi:dienelactone hydrolase
MARSGRSIPRPRTRKAAQERRDALLAPRGTRVPCLFYLLCLCAVAAIPAAAQVESIVTISTSLGDTTETFWLQIPQGYRPGDPCPLLIGWHQLGGDHREMKFSTTFDSIANARGWIAASHQGVSRTHWNNQATQSHVVDMIRWIEERYSVDPRRIYMVGASMGGAAGMVFSNNHLDPAGPRVAAAASLSGIQDCERRFHEQGINQSMIEAFGGTPEEVPFEYHRNSAIVFADTSRSMHWNARRLPLYLTFGKGVSDSIWRAHAEDLYRVMAAYADTVVLHESAREGHGWGCAEEGPICDFLGAFRLGAPPERLSINADEEGRWEWAEVRMREPGGALPRDAGALAREARAFARDTGAFARFTGAIDRPEATIDFTMVRNVASAVLDLPAVDFPVDRGFFVCRWSILDGGPAELAFLGVPAEPGRVLRDGELYEQWSYDPVARTLSIAGEGSAVYSVFFDASGVPDDRRGDPSVGRSGDRGQRAGPFAEEFDGRILDHALHFRLERPAGVRWSLFDLSGRRVDGSPFVRRPSGTTEADLSRRLRRGIYFLILETEEGTGGGSARVARKLIILR